MIGIEVRTKKLEDALFKLSQAGNVEFGKVIKQEGKYVLQTVIAFTPPPDRRQGRAAVEADAKKISNPLQYDYFKSRETTGGFYRSISRYIRRRDTEKLQRLFTLPQLSGFYGLRVISSIQELAGIHRKSQNARGRVGAKQNFATYATDFKRYLADVQARVGWTINGWVPAAKLCGAKYPRWTDKLKAIKYAKSQRSGEVRHNFGKNPFITAINHNVKIPDYQNKVRAALQARINVTERKLKRVLAGRAVNLGFVRVKGGQPVLE